MKNQKLELTWIGKDRSINLEPRILIEDKNKSYGEENTENMLVHGDNLLALKALEEKYTNKIKCIYIDPPYNTGSAFDHYDDNLEHSIWLNLMKKRLELLRILLADDGLIFVQIDDNEQAYLTILMDEIFGKNNRINTICVNMSNMSGVKVTSAIEGKRFPKIKEYILIYCKHKDKYKMKIPKKTKEKWDSEYNYIIPQITEIDFEEINNGNYENIIKNIDKYELISLKEYFKNNKIKDEDDTWKKHNSYRIVASKPNTALLKKCMKEKYNSEIAVVETSQGLKKLITTKFNRKTKTARIELVFAKSNLEVFWGDHWDDIVTTGGVGQEGNVEFKNGKKPEKLISRVIECSTYENDIVLDSFLGSGTTAAVAHKMKRRWIGIELGDHAYTHCKKRIDRIIDGNDNTGITEKFQWKGGGGYKFYELAPSLLVKDKFNNWIISENYNGELLAKAICKQEKFDYIEDSECYWKQGKSSENDYIFITTNYISIEYLDAIHEEMQDNESLLICCKIYQEECEERYDNITVKKIPQSILNNCEYGKDDYSLNVNEVLEIDENE